MTEPVNRGCRSGFTLLEILVATLLLLVVLGTILLLFRSLTAVQGAQMAKVEQQALSAIHADLSDHLRSVLITADCGLIARTDHLAFCALQAAGIGGEMDIIHWRFSLRDEELEVVRHQGETAQTNVIATGVSLFEAKTRSTDEEWQDHADPQTLPIMIQAITELKTGERGETEVFVPASLTTRSQIERR